MQRRTEIKYRYGAINRPRFWECCILFLAILTAEANILAQDKLALSDYKIEISSQDNLGSIIDKFSARNQIYFAYSPAIVDLIPNRQGIITGRDPSAILTDLFANQIHLQSDTENQILIRSINEISQEPSRPKIGVRIISEETLEPVSDVIVSLSGLSMHSITDAQGFAEIAAPNGGDVIFFNCLGYAPKVSSADEIERNSIIKLKPEPINMEPIIVLAPLVRKPSETHFSLSYSDQDHDILSLAGPGSRDILKSIQFLPGIKADDDLSAAIKIRGSEGSETLLILDGIPIHKSDHYYGVFSNINTGYVSESTLYKNTLPVEYGGKTGGLLILESDDAVSELTGDLESNLIYSQANLAFPLTKNWSLQLGGRVSYLNTVDHQIFDFANQRVESNRDRDENTRKPVLRSNPSFNFSDFNAKLLFNDLGKTKIAANFFHSSDHFDNSYDLVFLSSRVTLPVTSREISSNTEDWKSLGGSLNIVHELPSDWQLNANLYSSTFESNTKISSNLNRVSGQVFSFSNDQRNRLNELGGIFFVEKRKTDWHWKVGVDAKLFDIDVQLTEDERTLLAADVRASTSSAFSSLTKQLGSLKATVGSRLTYYSRKESWYLDPSLALEWTQGRLAFKGSVNYSHQFLRELNYENRLTQSFDYFVLTDDRFFPVGTSLNFMLGGQWQKGRWLIDVELYRRHLGGVVEYALRQPGFTENVGPPSLREYLIFTGEGRIKGMDTYIQYRSERFSSTLAYTLSENLRQMRGVRGGQYYPSEDDRRHQIKSANTYKMGKLSFHVNLVYSSGRPYLDLTRIDAQTDRRDFARNDFIQRLPSYERVDFGINYDFDLWQKRASIGASCFNLFDRDNVKYLQYIYNLPGSGSGSSPIRNVVGTQAGLLPRTYNLSFHIQF